MENLLLLSIFVHQRMSKLKDPFLDVLLVKIKVTYQVVKKKRKRTQQKRAKILPCLSSVLRV